MCSIFIDLRSRGKGVCGQRKGKFWRKVSLGNLASVVAFYQGPNNIHFIFLIEARIKYATRLRKEAEAVNAEGMRNKVFTCII